MRKEGSPPDYDGVVLGVILLVVVVLLVVKDYLNHPERRRKVEEHFSKRRMEAMQEARKVRAVEEGRRNCIFCGDDVLSREKFKGVPDIVELEVSFLYDIGPLLHGVLYSFSLPICCCDDCRKKVMGEKRSAKIIWIITLVLTLAAICHFAYIVNKQMDPGLLGVMLILLVVPLWGVILLRSVRRTIRLQELPPIRYLKEQGLGAGVTMIRVVHSKKPKDDFKMW